MGIGKLAKPVIGLAKMSFREFKNGGKMLLDGGRVTPNVLGHISKGAAGLGLLVGGSKLLGWGGRKVFSTNKRKNRMNIR